MTHIKVDISVDGHPEARIVATRTDVGPDGIDTYAWFWGLHDHNQARGAFWVVDNGHIQHTETNGAFALVRSILGRILLTKDTK